MSFQSWLHKHYACQAGRNYVGDREAQTFWNQCEIPSYMGWLARRLYDRRLISSATYRAVLSVCSAADRHIVDVEGANRIRVLMPTLPMFVFGEFLSQREVALLKRTFKADRKARRR